MGINRASASANRGAWEYTESVYSFSRRVNDAFHMFYISSESMWSCMKFIGRVNDELEFLFYRDGILY